MVNHCTLTTNSQADRKPRVFPPANNYPVGIVIRPSIVQHACESVNAQRFLVSSNIARLQIVTTVCWCVRSRNTIACSPNYLGLGTCRLSERPSETQAIWFCGPWAL